MFSCINADYIKEWYAVFIYLIYTIEKKDFKIRSEVEKGIRVHEENNCHMAIMFKLDTAPKAFAFKLVYQGVNRVLALVGVLSYFSDSVVDILTRC